MKEAQGNPRLALNQLASEGHTGGRPRYDETAPLGCYGFDTYARRVIEAGEQALAEYLKPSGEPITGVVLHGGQGIPVSQLLIYDGTQGPGSGVARVSLDVTVDARPIPAAYEDTDLLLETFCYRFGFQETRPDVGLFDEEPALNWEVSTLPDSLYCLVMMRAATALARGLAGKGYQVASTCIAGYARQDLLLSDDADQLALVQRQLQRNFGDSDALRAFAGLCHASPDDQQRLIQLAMAP
ncbi:hypothetical protein ACN28I_03840 [Archangium gephyra]|uniref:hypothetical protein n=1 Tax=Archangium gephyra TaxID=48 RepID=UPI003B7FB3A7